MAVHSRKKTARKNQRARKPLTSKYPQAFGSFELKKTLYATAIGVIGSSCLAGNALAAVTYYNADSTNTTISTVGLSAGYLGNSTLSNPSALTTGSNMYKYAVIQFTATEDGTYYFGQTYAPTDTIMIMYNGVYDASNPGAGAIVGNDDTPQANHQAAIGSSISTMCGTTSYCPQISLSVVAGVTYSLFVSAYTPGQSNLLDVPFEFYSTGSVVFGTHTGRSPIDMMQPSYNSSDLGVTVDPMFVGGTLVMDQVNGIYTDDFTLANMTSSTIDQNGNHSIFMGVFSDAVSGTPGHIAIDNTGSGGSVSFTGINTYTGSTILKGGVLAVSQDANLGDPSATLVLDGGTLLTAASFDSSRAVSLMSTGTVNVAGNAVLTMSGTVSGAGSVTKDGTGTLVLNGNNTYAGTTAVAAGTLAVGDSSNPGATLSGGGNITVANGAALGGMVL